MLTDTNYLEDVCWPVEEATKTAAYCFSFMFINFIVVCVLLWQQYRDNIKLRNINEKVESETDLFKRKNELMSYKLDAVIFQVEHLRYWVKNLQELVVEDEGNCVLEEQEHSLFEEDSSTEGENALSDNDNHEQEESDS